MKKETRSNRSEEIENPRSELSRHPVCSSNVASENARGETVNGVVCESDDFLLGIESRHGHNGAEDFLLNNLHVGGDITEDGLQVSLPLLSSDIYSQAR